MAAAKTNTANFTHVESSSSPEAVAEFVRAAYEAETAVFPVGGGTSLDFGLPGSRPGVGLKLTGLNRVIDFPARDMTITVEVGITMESLAQTLASERLRLPIDAPQAALATLGGVIATNTNGPRRFGCGSMRDYVIGIHAVDGRGQPFKGGGRVVKNVAGYDFCKLLTGSLGTLGVITHATLKVRPLAEKLALVACRAADLVAADKVLSQLNESKTTPVSIALLAGEHWNAHPATADLVKNNGLAIVVGLEGTAVEVEWMCGQLAREWEAQGLSPLRVDEAHVVSVWSLLVEFPALPGSPLVLKASLRPSGVAAFMAAAQQVDPRCSMLAHAGSGTVFMRCAEFPQEGLSRALVGRLQPTAAAALGHVTVLSNPGGAEITRHSVWGAGESPVWLMAEVKKQFDPRNILNPGRFVMA